MENDGFPDFERDDPKSIKRLTAVGRFYGESIDAVAPTGKFQKQLDMCLWFVMKINYFDNYFISLKTQLKISKKKKKNAHYQNINKL